MDIAHPLGSPIVVRSLKVKNDTFRLCKKSEELLSPKVLYFNAIDVLMYLVNCTRPNIVFPVNLLIRYSSTPTQRY